MPFILTQFSSIPSLLRSFNHGWMLNFVKKVLRSFWNQCSRPCDIFPQLFSLCSICLFSIVVIQLLRHVRFFATPWTLAHQAPLSMEFSRQQYWSGLPFPTPGDLPNPGIKPVSPASLALAGRFFIAEPPGKPFKMVCLLLQKLTTWGGRKKGGLGGTGHGRTYGWFLLMYGRKHKIL